tara:strand:+ start:22869 stop:23261 length:393 start_codon:yes stop_codon:yes gene_type:complete
MPERVTKEERIVSLAIEKARKAKELLQQESTHERLPLEDELVVEKITRPKAKNVKLMNQTDQKEGYGLAGESIEHTIKKNIRIKRQREGKEILELLDSLIGKEMTTSHKGKIVSLMTRMLSSAQEDNLPQ